MDQLLDQIGDFGTYQKRTFAALSGLFLMSSAIQFVIIFTMAEPLHRCRISENDTYYPQDDAHNESIQLQIPKDNSGSLSSCEYYPNSTFSQGARSCDSYVYDTSEVGQTIAGQFDLICEKRLLAATITTTGFLGRCVGSLALGALSDKFGRQRTMAAAVALLLVMCAASAAPNPYSYMVFRFISMCCSVGIYDCALIINMEIVGPKKRTFVNTLAGFIFTCGSFMLVAAAYALRDWQHLSMFVAAPFAILLAVTVWLVPESPRWLLMMGKAEEAKAILQRAAAANGTVFPEQSFTEIIQEEQDNAESNDFRALLASRVMLKRLLLFFLLWVSVDLAYFGIGLEVGYLFGGIYVNNAIGAAVEIPCLALVYASFYLGRKKTNLAVTAMSTVGLVSAGLLQLFSSAEGTGYLVVAATMLAKLGTASCYLILYVWTLEAFPTGYRNLTLGACSGLSGIGSAIAPFIIDIDAERNSSSQAKSSIIFGAVLGVCSIAAIALPETSKENLPDYIKGAENADERTSDSVGVANNYLELLEKAESTAQPQSC